MKKAQRKAFRMIDRSEVEIDLAAFENVLAEIEDLDRPSRGGETLLYRAVAMGDAEAVDAILRHGASVDEGYQGHGTPLHLACGHHAHAMIAQLLGAGADPSRLDDSPEKKSCLYRLLDGPIFSRRRIIASMRGLCEAGADPNIGRAESGESPLILLCSGGSFRSRRPLVEVLIELGADPNRRSVDGYSPLMAAVYSGKWWVAKCLRKHGADEQGVPTARLHRALFGSATLLDFLRNRDQSNIPDSLEALAQGADPNTPSPSGELPLVTALLYGDDAIVTALIEAGAAVDPPGEGRRLPLMAATETGRTKWVERLLELGADPIRDTDYGMAMECAKDPAIRQMLESAIAERWPDIVPTLGLGLVSSDSSTRFLAVRAPRKTLLPASTQTLAETADSIQVAKAEPGERWTSASDSYLLLRAQGNAWAWLLAAETVGSSRLRQLAKGLSQRLPDQEIVLFENDDFRGFVAYDRFRNGASIEHLFWGDPEFAPTADIAGGPRTSDHPEDLDEEGGVRFVASTELAGAEDPRRDPVELVHDRLVALGVPALPWTDRDLWQSPVPERLALQPYGRRTVLADILSCRS